MRDKSDDPKVQAAWLAEQRTDAREYMKEMKLRGIRLNRRPEWFVVPYLAIWRATAVSHPEKQGWLISGDVPMDYLESSEIDHPRQAMQAFADRWKELSASMLAGKRHPQLSVGPPEMQKELGELLQARSKILQKWANDDAIW